MIKRKQSATVDLKVRMKEPLRAALEREAKKHGISMNSEAVDRLQRSFDEDESWGNSEIHNMARLMAAAFVRGGQMSHGSKKTTDWINSPPSYENAVICVVEALFAAAPFDDDSLNTSNRKPIAQKLANIFARSNARRIGNNLRKSKNKRERS